MKIAIGVSPVTKMLEAGVTISLGTDTCAVNDNMDLFEAMRVGAFLQKVSSIFDGRFNLIDIKKFE